MTFYIIKLLIMLPIMAVLIYGCLWAYRKYQPGLSQMRQKNNLSIDETLPLGNAGRLAIVNFHGKKVLIAVSRGKITPISEIGLSELGYSELDNSETDITDFQDDPDMDIPDIQDETVSNSYESEQPAKSVSSMANFRNILNKAKENAASRTMGKTTSQQDGDVSDDEAGA